MKFKFCALSLLFAMMLFSCKNNEGDVTLEDIEVNESDTAREINNDNAVINSDSIIKKLKGKWKENEYPFREVHFENTKVKFIEEGVAAESAFREYTISKDCPFEVNNIKNAGGDDIFLVIAETSTCEIINVSNDTLTLNGFNVSSNSDYHIIYKRME